MPSPPLVTLSPRVVQAMRPCAVRLTGSVRLQGNTIVPLPPAGAPQAAAAATTPPYTPTKPLRPAATPPTAPHKPAKRSAPTSSAQSSANILRRPPPRRELSFTSLAQPGGGTPTLLPLHPAPPTAAAAPASLLALMRASPRKRARKSQAPHRAAASSEDAAAEPAQADLPRNHGSFQGESGGSMEELLSTAERPPKAPR